MSAQIYAPDGTLQTTLNYFTTLTSVFLTGTYTSDSASFQVSIRGGAFSSDPDLILVTPTGFTVPNPAAYPNGLELLSGLNVIQIQTTSVTGAISGSATANLSLVSQTPAFLGTSPTGVTLERMANAVNVTVMGSTDSNLLGYNLYASTVQGGGDQGYTRVNLYLITASTPQNVQSLLGTLDAVYGVVGTQPNVRVVATQEDIHQTTLSTDMDGLVAVPSGVSQIETVVNVYSNTTVNNYSFLHDRNGTSFSVPPTIANNQFSSINDTDPLYYVMTAVYYDPVTGTQYESVYSPEVVGYPITIARNTTGLPSVQRSQLLQNLVTSIFRTRPDVALQPGAVIRDTVVDPFITEAERIRFVMDFLYRASSFDTLLQLDDPNNTGTSVPVSQSPYKQSLGAALFLTGDSNIQGVIDRAFEKLASNFGVSRGSGNKAQGYALFYTTTTPTRTLPIPLGTTLTAGSTQFQTLTSASIPLSSLASYFNPSTGQYSVQVLVRAVKAGSAGNIGPNQLSGGAPSGLSVTNTAAFLGGTDQQTNRDLATECLNKIASVDVGTEQGYLTTASNVAGVLQVSEVSAGNPAMLRDIDPSTGLHVGGMVDLWVVGNTTASQTDNFAFTYTKKYAVQFVPIGNPLSLTFQAIDPSLSPSNPLVSMLDYSALGLGLRDATTGARFNLTGVTYPTYNTIQLSNTVTQPTFTFGDVLLGDYRYQTGTSYVFSVQPVSAVTLVKGQVSGVLPTTGYTLVHQDDPMKNGLSSKAQDYLLIQGTSIPSGNLIAVSGETHTLVGSYTEFVDNLGAESLSVVVTSTDGLTTYNGPFSTGSIDYTIQEGNQTTALGIRRTTTSSIHDGQKVEISYSYNENFSVTYTTNPAVQNTQAALASASHANANVLAKAANNIQVDITATVLLVPGTVPSTVDTALRTNLANALSAQTIGNVLFRQGDAIGIIKDTTGVSAPVVPLTKLSPTSGSSILMENLDTSQIGDSFRVDGWSTQTVGVWLIVSELTTSTMTGGGSFGQFVGVYEDNVIQTLQTTNPVQLGSLPGKAYIIGTEGLNIPGYSDDATLTAQGYVTPTQILNRRILITANRILVTLLVGDSPYNHTYNVTYVAVDNESAMDLSAGPVSYYTLGNVTFTYAEDPGLSH